MSQPFQLRNRCAHICFMTALPVQELKLQSAQVGAWRLSGGCCWCESRAIALSFLFQLLEPGS
jgi:hypothetical protein